MSGKDRELLFYNNHVYVTGIHPMNACFMNHSIAISINRVNN